MPQPIDREFQASALDFERLIGPTLRGTAAELERSILAAGLKPAELEAIYLAGGSSRIPLVARILQERLGVMPSQLDDPKAVIALGAAKAERKAAHDSSINERPLAPEGVAISRSPAQQRPHRPTPPPLIRTRPRSTSRHRRSRRSPSHPGSR